MEKNFKKIQEQTFYAIMKWFFDSTFFLNWQIYLIQGDID